MLSQSSNWSFCFFGEDLASSIIYLDESGDLGWNFAAPYRNGGSSRHLTITALCVPSEKSHLPKRLVKNLYQQHNWPRSGERKWVDMSRKARNDFANCARRMCDLHDDIHLHAIVVKKENVEEHIRKDSNKLYNFMIRLCLLDRMCLYDSITLFPDPRSIKVKSGNSLHDYLQTELWFTKKVKTTLATHPADSRSSLGVQFADMLAGVVQSRFEDNDLENFKIIYPRLKLSTLFF